MRYKFLLLAILMSVRLFSQSLPLGYITHYQCDFSTPKYDSLLLFTPSAKTTIDKGVLKVSESFDTNTGFFPTAAMLVDYNIFGDFISEISFAQHQKIADSLAAIYVICGLRDSLNYYLLKLDNKGAMFMKMYKGKITDISSDSSFKLIFGKPVKLRIERDILNRSVTIKSQGKKAIFTDPNLVMGYFGVGAEDIPLYIDRFIIWAPTSMAEKAPLF